MKVISYKEILTQVIEKLISLTCDSKTKSRSPQYQRASITFRRVSSWGSDLGSPDKIQKWGWPAWRSGVMKRMSVLRKPALQKSSSCSWNCCSSELEGWKYSGFSHFSTLQSLPDLHWYITGRNLLTRVSGKCSSLCYRVDYEKDRGWIWKKRD